MIWFHACLRRSGYAQAGKDARNTTKNLLAVIAALRETFQTHSLIKLKIIVNIFYLSGKILLS